MDAGISIYWLAPMPTLPDYIAKATPNPLSNRAPWYVNTAPSYAGVFLWIGFYQSIAQGTLVHAGPLLCLAALAVAAVAELRPLLLCSGHAGHANRLSALRGW